MTDNRTTRTTDTHLTSAYSRLRPQTRSRRIAAALIVACLLALAGSLAGCSEQPGSSSGAPTEAAPVVLKATVFVTSAPATPTAPPAPTPTATPEPPKPIVMAVVGEPRTLHPLYATSQVAQTVLAPVFVGCVGQDETGAPVALGCERVPTLENGDAKFIGEGDDRHLEVTFRIRPGWRWTDGKPVTAQDALYTWQLVMAPEAQLRDPLTQKVFAMTAPDEHTIVVSFMSAAQARAAAAGTLLGDVAFEYFGQQGDYARYAEQAAPLADANYWAVVRWLPSHVLAAVPPRDQLGNPFAAQPMGDGAFEITAWNKGADLTLTRSSQPFPLTPAGNAPGIVFKFAPDETTAAQWAQAGEAQLSQPLSVDAIGPITGTEPAFDLIRLPMPVFEQIVLNASRPPFDDVKVRQALRLAIDPQALMADPATGPVTAPLVLNPASLFHGVAPNALVLNFDPAQARALLRDAGWACDVLPCVKPVSQDDGSVVTQTLEFTLVTNERVPRNALSQAIQRQLGAAGFGVDIRIVRGLGGGSRLFAPYEAGGILMTRDFDAALYQAPSLEGFTGALDCASVPSEDNHALTQGNASGYCDPAADGLFAEAEAGESTISDAASAQAIQAALVAVSDAAPIVPLYSPVWVVASRGVTGLRYAGFGIVSWNAWEWQR